MSIFRKVKRAQERKAAKEFKQKYAKKGKRLVKFKDKDGKMRVTAIDVQKPYRKGDQL